MGRTNSNVGEIGASSIRLGGMKLEDLPIAEAASAASQFPATLEAERENEIAGIRAVFPKQTIEYLESRVRECRSNLRKFREERSRIESQRAEYKGILALCKVRDNQIAEIENHDPEKPEKIRALEKQFGLYQVEPMETQIRQFGESIQRFDETVAKEQESLTELRELIKVCEIRDRELSKLGA